MSIAIAKVQQVAWVTAIFILFLFMPAGASAKDSCEQLRLKINSLARLVGQNIDAKKGLHDCSPKTLELNENTSANMREQLPLRRQLWSNCPTYKNSSPEVFERSIKKGEEADAVFRESCPQLVPPLLTKGILYTRKGDYHRAISMFDEVIQIQPENADAYNGRCWAQAIAGQLDQALKDCKESLRLRPNNIPTLNSRGLVYLKLSQFDNAITDYDAALKGDPKHASSLYGRGLAQQKKGEHASSEADIVAAKAIDPDVVGDFVRYGVTAPVQTSAPAPLPATDCAQAETHWKTAEEIKSVAIYQDHLARFPTCNFAALATARIKQLKK